MNPFHLAFPILDKETTRTFYGDLLSCEIGREAERWIDFNFFGNQLSAHVVDEYPREPLANPVDGKQVPVKHFGRYWSGAHGKHSQRSCARMALSS